MLAHPQQLETCRRIEELLDLLAYTKTDADFFSFQVELYREVFRAQTERGEAKRHLTLEQKGRPVPTPAAGSWELEERVWDRIQLQLRTVGDAMAWRRLGFDRRYILAYSRNSDPGPITGRLPGLVAELDRVEAEWREGRFALLHDLTTALRIADLTVFTPRGPVADEVKANPKKKATPDQLRRMQEALDFLSGRTALKVSGGDLEEFVSSVPFKAHFRELERGLHLAETEHGSATVLGRGWVLICYVGTTNDPQDAEADVPEQFAAFEKRRERAYRRSGLQSTTHLLKVVAVGELGVNPGMAPPTIFPIASHLRALLVCDLAAYQPTIAWSRIGEAFESVGFSVTCPLPPQDEAVGEGREVLIATIGRRRLSIASGAFAQMALELVDPERYAQALKEAVMQGTRPTRGLLTFSNERATWR